MDRFSIVSTGCIKAQDTFFVVGEENSVFTVKVQETAILKMYEHSCKEVSPN